MSGTTYSGFNDWVYSPSSISSSMLLSVLIVDSPSDTCFPAGSVERAHVLNRSSLTLNCLGGSSLIGFVGRPILKTYTKLFDEEAISYLLSMVN